MLDLFGPASAPNAVTVRPSDNRSFGLSDTFFQDCSSSTLDDGTELQAAVLNQLIAVCRSVARGNGNLIAGLPVITEDNASDAIILNAVLQLIQRGQATYATDTGGVNNLVIAPFPACLEYKDGLRFIIKVANTNTGPCTLTASGIGNKPIAYDNGNMPMRPGDILGGCEIEVSYNSSNGGYWQLIGFLQSAVKKTAFKKTRATFITPGAFSFTVPAGVSTLKLYGWSAGGGGGFSGPGGGASGGGGGARGEQTVDVTPGQVINGTLGAGGAAATTSGADGSAGGDSTITVGATTYTLSGGPGGHSVVSGTANSVSGGAPSLFVDIAQIGEPSGGGLHGYSGTGDLFYAGKGGNASNGGLGGLAGTGAGNPGIAPGGAGAGGANNNAAGAGARGEWWIEY